MTNLLTLSNIEESDLPKVGQRAIDLSQIHKSKFPVPLSFVVPNLLFHEFLLQNKLGLEIRKILNTPNKSDDALEDIYAKIKYLFEYAMIPVEFREELLEVYETLSSEETIDAQGLIDGDEPVVNLIISPSYAWKSEKFTGILLNIQGFDNFLNGLKSCWLSLYSPEHLKLREADKINEFSAGIIVQKFVSADCTVDAYSKSILGNYEIPITAYFGLPDITYKINKDTYNISRETFGIEFQEIRPQEHILLRNAKSGTLIKRNLSKRGTAQKILDKHIFEIARLIDRTSSISKKHFRLLIFIQNSKSSIFFADRLGDRDVEAEKIEISQHKKIYSVEPTTTAKDSKESLADILQSPVSSDEIELLDKKEQSNQSTTKKEELEAFAWETTIKSNTNPDIKNTQPIKAIILEDNKSIPLKPDFELENGQNPAEEQSKLIIFDENSSDDFILSSKSEKENSNIFAKDESFLKKEFKIDNLIKQEHEPKEKEPIIIKEKTTITIEETKTTEDTKTTEKEVKITENSTQQTILGPDNEFYMSIILDLEPTIDQEILKKYQDKFNKVPTNITSALEELDETNDFPEKEQIFKLKNMKDMLERGETINLDVFLEVTERLRRVL